MSDWTIKYNMYKGNFFPVISEEKMKVCKGNDKLHTMDGKVFGQEI